MSNLKELNYAIISELRDQLEAKEQMIKSLNEIIDSQQQTNEALSKRLKRAEWWLHEIVENHRFTPISTAEMALKELTESKNE